MNRRKNLRYGGFTMVELMSILVILGLLAAVVATNVVSKIDKAKVTTTKTSLKVLDDAVIQFKLDTGEFPSEDVGLDELVEENSLLRSRNGEQWFSVRKNVHREVDLRGTGQSFIIKKSMDNRMLGMIDGFRCLKECHPGAIYLHRGETWLVQDLDLEGHEVRVERKNVNYFTRTLGRKETEILKVEDTVSLRHFRASLGSLRVTDRVTGYERKLVRGQKTIASEPLDLPPNIFETEGLWFEIPADPSNQNEPYRMAFLRYFL